MRSRTFIVLKLTQVGTGGEKKKRETRTWSRLLWEVLRKVKGRTLNHLCTPAPLCWLNNWGADGWISEEGCWEHFRREPRSSISVDDQILFQQELISGRVWNTLEGFFQLWISLLVLSSCDFKCILMKDLLRLHLKGKSNLKIQVFCFLFFFFFYTFLAAGSFSTVDYLEKHCLLVLLWPLPLNFLKNGHVSIQIYC